jgi:hypothetical protein
MTTRQYSSRSQQSTLTGTITSGATSMTVVSGTALLGGVTIPSGRTFTLVIDPDTALEEIVDATAVSTNTFTITRAIDGSSAQAHSAGAVVRHMAIGRDYRDANLHAEADASYNDGAGSAHTMHGIASGEGVVVGTLKTQTLTNKTLTSPTISNPTFTGTPSAEASIVFEGATPDAFETTLTVVDPTQDNTITLPNTTGTVVIADATQTLTNKTLTSPTISGSPVITGLSSAGMVASSATPKDYVDAILGSATAAATSAASAATSATSAATSASSASTSASSALTSANSAATSATAAATSATSAAASATAAATSATSAAASATTATNQATAAATSASSAAASASSATTSASSALTSANSASTSASSALTSANSASTSATAAATSATSAATTYDNFDDRYLGSKASAPTVDNDGNTLLVGAIYWNSTLNNMYVWSGTVWVQIATTSSYSAPTLGSTTIASGATVSNVDALTINSTTIPTSKTLVVTTDKLSALAATTSAELAGVISDETGSGALVFGTAPTLSSPIIGTINTSGTGISGNLYPSITNAGINIGVGQTIGDLNIGTGASRNTGAINIGTGASSTGTKNINIGTGSTGGTTTINIGSTAGATSTVTISGTSTITPADGTTTTAASGAGFMGMPQNATTTGAYTIVAADAGKHIYSTATRTVTIPANSALALPVGTVLTFISSVGTTTISITTDTMYLAGVGTTGSRTLAVHGMATAVKTAATTWYISGNGLT